MQGVTVTGPISAWRGLSSRSLRSIDLCVGKARGSQVAPNLEKDDRTAIIESWFSFRRGNHLPLCRSGFGATAVLADSLVQRPQPSC